MALCLDLLVQSIDLVINLAKDYLQVLFNQLNSDLESIKMMT